MTPESFGAAIQRNVATGCSAVAIAEGEAPIPQAGCGSSNHDDQVLESAEIISLLATRNTADR